MADEPADGMQCSDHPYRRNPGGICAFCLQEKLRKLVSSSKSSDPFLSVPPLPSPSSPPPPSDLPSVPRIPFLSSKTKPPALQRSQSVAARTPRKKSFWSFLALSHPAASPISSSFATKRRSTSSAAVATNCASEQLPKEAKEDEASDASPSGSHASSSFGRKVARSRSVGCGSRSFSGDFLERISNGFGDCALRRVESHREAKPRGSVPREDCGEEERRVKCGGIFVGLGMTTTYWLSAADSVRLPPARRGGRSRSWGWAFASPMRAFRPGGGGGGGQTTVVLAGDQ